ncbi:uncharacterized protein LACBIDRAFT_328493 [Laccaria bicolor S238N-H82]|uniref:Predicted protein n=1 Tax=Laccaria bicolor (strain S238N-H82 / ATCC MYA-4686) TaxID=486041 RepID=B0DF05_LACBS|nr:uncharacterized protein LACBIDRAFT_328493 [Laccaria bicolor S238N-H82]EDR06636.1 predicted protein [Laccaria bicolor S238N-H82]|eukprot:XP_001882483.1 predicted protein [Laccaria bicolor S238N-H82]
MWRFVGIHWLLVQVGQWCWALVAVPHWRAVGAGGFSWACVMFRSCGAVVVGLLAPVVVVVDVLSPGRHLWRVASVTWLRAVAMAESGGGCRMLARGGGGGGGRERDGHADSNFAFLVSSGIQWTMTGLIVHWTGTGLRKVACSPWTGHCASQSGLATGPLESRWITWGMVKTLVIWPHFINPACLTWKCSALDTPGSNAIVNTAALQVAACSSQSRKTLPSIVNLTVNGQPSSRKLPWEVKSLYLYIG